MKLCKYSDNYFIFNKFYLFLINCESNQPIKLRHRTGLDGIHDVDVGLHGLVIGVAGPINGYAVFRYPHLGNASKLGISLCSSTVHHDVRGDAQGQSVDDEGAATGMGADELPLGLDLVGADVALVGGHANLLIDAGEFAQLLDVAVHRLVGVVREGLAVLEGSVLVFLQDGLGDLVQFDGNTVRCLDGRDLDVVTLDIAPAEVIDVGVPEAGEATEEMFYNRVN